MLGATPIKYRSRYTGVQIDNLLASISNKLDKSHISNDFNGGTEIVASAELAKILYLDLNKFNDPNYITQLILSIPNALIFTKEDKDKIDRLGGFFQGSFKDAATRNASVSTVGFKGGELTFLMGNSDNHQQLDYWDAATLSWKMSLFEKQAEDTTTSHTTSATKVIITIPKTQYRTAKYGLRCESISQVWYQEINIVQHVDNIFWTTSLSLGDNPSLCTVTSVTQNTQSILVNCLVGANTTTKFKELMLL